MRLAKLGRRFGSVWLRLTAMVRVALDGLDAFAGKWLGLERVLK